MNEDSSSDESSADDPIPLPAEDDATSDEVDGEAVVVPGQRPGPTEPTPF